MNSLELLAAHGDRAKLISGGQSLMPAMNLRLISTEPIVDISEIAELRAIGGSWRRIFSPEFTRRSRRRRNYCWR
jgi:CO/xanthine dehydrogenase FAD-binding subunit